MDTSVGPNDEMHVDNEETRDMGDNDVMVAAAWTFARSVLSCSPTEAAQLGFSLGSPEWNNRGFSSGNRHPLALSAWVAAPNPAVNYM
eukprot:1196326-Prorocentrum_minimum.AAC.6